MSYFTMPTGAVNPQAARLYDGSSGAISAEGKVSLPYDFTDSPWADMANFYTSVDNTNSYLDQSKIDALASRLQDGGFQVMQAGDSVGNGSYSWVQDANGNIVAKPQYTTNNDPNFLAAMVAAGAFAGGSAAGLAGGGASGGQTAAGLLGDSAGFGGFSGNLTGGIGAEFGLGSLGAETAAGLVAPGAAGSGGALLAAPGASSGFGSLGGFTSQLGNLGGAASGGAAATGAAPGGSTLGSVGSGLLDFAKSNPNLIGGLLGAGLGAIGANEGDTGQAYNGPMPTITRGEWKPQAQATMMQSPGYGNKALPTTGQANSGLWRYRG